jgi:outer membrane protein, multidrug efflux system
MIGPIGARDPTSLCEPRGIDFGIIGLVRKVAVTSAIFILSGCVTLAPLPEPRSPVPLPDRFLAAPQGALDPAELPEAWWRELGDPRLDALVGEAFAANPSLQVAASRLTAAEARARIAGADLLPRADLGLETIRRRQVFVGLPIRAAEDRAIGTTAGTFGTSLNLSWEIDLWGRIRAGER